RRDHVGQPTAGTSARGNVRRSRNRRKSCRRRKLNLSAAFFVSLKERVSSSDAAAGVANGTTVTGNHRRSVVRWGRPPDGPLRFPVRQERQRWPCWNRNETWSGSSAPPRTTRKPGAPPS